MDAAEEQIKNWANKNEAFVSFLGLDRVNLCLTFSAGLEQKSIFQIYINNEAIPMFVMSDDAPLRDWLERINTFIQRREGTITLLLLQNEMETSLKLLFKIGSEPSKPSFTFTPPQSSNEAIPPWAQNPPQWSSNNTGVPFGARKVGQANSTLSGSGDFTLPEKTVESVRKDIEAWRDSHENAKLVISEIKRHDDAEHWSISLVMGELAIPFNLLCNSDWTLAAISSEHEVLTKLVEEFSSYITTTTPALETFFDDFAKLLEHYKDAWQSGAIESIAEGLKELVAEELGESATAWTRVIPTANDFDREILPALHNFMSADGLEIWQIDEWLRRCRIEFDKSSGERNDAMQFIIHNVFHGQNPPRAIRKFFPPPLPLHRRVTVNDNWKYPPTATETAKENLRQQMSEMDALQEEDHGFIANPIRNNLFHWEIKLHGFDPETRIGQELINYTVNVSDDSEKIPKDANGKVKPLNIVMEIKLPPNYPHGSPSFRIIRPRIFNELEEQSFEDDLNEDEFGNEKDSRLELDDSTEKLKPQDGAHPLSFSMALERRKWNTCPKIIDLVRQIRGTLSRANHLRVDLQSSKKGIPTDGNFWNEYVCLAASSVTSSYSDADLGGKILLPSSALNELMGRSLYGSGGFNLNYGLGESGSFQNDSPMIFEIATPSGRRSFVGVMEFRAPEGHVGLPHWMMASLGITAGQSVQIRKVHLPKGLFFQLQPHSADFQRVSNVKAMMEWVLRRFVAVAEGDKIQVEHDGKKYRFNVLKCTPERAVAITDADVSVEFAAPVEGVVSEETNELTRSQEIKVHEEQMAKEKKDQVTLGSMFPQGKEGVDFKTCPNCFQPIPISNALHELTCMRRNWYCKDCKTVVLKTEQAAHMKEFHEMVSCEWCSNQVEKRLLFNHKKNDCSGRSVSCSFCEMKLLAKQLYEHEKTCGSVTEVCEKCRGRFPRRELPYHESACTGTRPPPNRGPAGGRNRPNEDFMACEKCSQAFTQFDELQVHILTMHSDEYDKFALFGGPGFKKEENATPATPAPSLQADESFDDSEFFDANEFQ